MPSNKNKQNNNGANINDQNVGKSGMKMGAQKFEIPPILRMYLDENRDGQVDQAPANCPIWQWGQSGKGAILMVNCRQGAGYSFTSYNDNDPVLERIELRFLWDPDEKKEDKKHKDVGRGILTIDKPDRVLFFSSRTYSRKNEKKKLPSGDIQNLLVHANVVKLEGNQIRITDAMSLWMEAADYPAGTSEDDARVTLTYTYTTPNQGVTIVQTSQLRIAPWIMASDLDRTSKVISLAVDPPAQLQQPIPPQLTRELQKWSESAKATYIGFEKPEDGVKKPFLRDVMKSGWVMAPHRSATVILRNLDGGNKLSLIPDTLMKRGVPQQHIQADTSLGTVQKPELIIYDDLTKNPNRYPVQTGQDAGGNLLVSPPLAKYPYGRIICGDWPKENNQPGWGDRCHAISFFNAQRYQEPIVLDVSWLQVGHVDEFVSFIPNPADNNWKYKILLASPRLGYCLAWAASTAAKGTPVGQVIENAMKLSEQAYADKLEGKWITELLKQELGPPQAVQPPDPLPQMNGYEADPQVPGNTDRCLVLLDKDGRYKVTALDGYLKKIVANDQNLVEARLDRTQPKIDKSRETLLRKLSNDPDKPLDGSYIIEIPVLLGKDVDSVDPDDPAPPYVTATADSVNMLILNQVNGLTCVIPKPFGPVFGGQYLFEAYIREQLVALNNQNLQFTFVNDWVDLHVRDGEIHCGTNQLPDLAVVARPWWHKAPPQ